METTSGKAQHGQYKDGLLCKLHFDVWKKGSSSSGHNIQESTVAVKAKAVRDETGRRDKPYTGQAVPKSETGPLSDTVVKSVGMYPDLPVKADPDQRPFEASKKNAGLGRIREAAFAIYKQMRDSAGENSYKKWVEKMMGAHPG